MYCLNLQGLYNKEIKMKKKFAYILMGNHYNPDEHKAVFETDNQITYIFTVKNLKEAIIKAKKLKEEKIGIIELCGAFGEEGANRIIEATDNEIGIGYVVNKEEQEPIFSSFFSKSLK